MKSKKVGGICHDLFQENMVAFAWKGCSNSRKYQAEYPVLLAGLNPDIFQIQHGHITTSVSLLNACYSTSVQFNDEPFACYARNISFIVIDHYSLSLFGV
jgi:hypothetical protein